MIDVFAETRRLVSARSAAEFYGFHPNRAGFIACPFHHEKTASLKLYSDGGGFYCYGCQTGGSVIDFVRKLFDLSSLDAVRRLNADFHLTLPLDKPPDKTAQAEFQRRKELLDTYQLFERWRNETIRELNACFWEGHFALKVLSGPKDFDRLTSAQTLAIRWQAYFEWLSDTLSDGDMDEVMEIFREGGELKQLCKTVLNGTQTKSGVA